MTKSSPKNNPEANLKRLKESRLALFGRVSASTVVVMAIMAAVGLLLDQVTGKSPVFLIAALALGFPAVQFVVFKSAKGLAHKKLK